MGLQILETRIVGCENVKNVINEAIARSKAQAKDSSMQQVG